MPPIVLRRIRDKGKDIWQKLTAEKRRGQ